MASADHSQFQFAAERYVLDELSDEEKLAFEEHYFSCGACAQDVEDLTAIRMAAPATLPQLRSQTAHVDRKPWFSAIWPQFALGLSALLVLVSGYQNAVQIPRLRAASDDALQIMAAPRPLIAQRGAGTLMIAGLPRTAPVAIANEWPVSYPRYEARITRHGSTEPLLNAEAEVAEGNLLLTIPARKLGAGNFDLVVSGKSLGGTSQDVARYVFTIGGAR